MRSEQIPEVRVSQTLSGRGRIQRDERQIEVSHFTLTRSRFDPRTPWSFSAVLPVDQSRSFYAELNVIIGAASFTGSTFDDFEIEIPQLYSVGISDGMLRGKAREMRLGSHTIPTRPSEQRLSMQLSPTRLALPEKDWLSRSYTGEITDTGFAQENEHLTFPTEFGPARLVLRYSYASALVGETSATMQVPIPTIEVEIKPDSITDAPHALAKVFAEQIEPALDLLSFLSRRHVRWTSLRIESKLEPVGDGDRYHRLAWERASVLSDLESGDDRVLVNPYRINSDGFVRMLDSLHSLPYREALMSATIYLIASLDALYVEPRLMNAFTALETITNGINREENTDSILPRSAFRKLRKKVETVVRSYWDTESLNADRADLVMNKLSELNRPAISHRLSILIRRFGVEWRDLFPPKSELQRALSDMYGRRSKLVHAGRMTSITQTDMDAIRAHALAERLIYNILGGDDRGWLDPQSYDAVSALPAMQHAVENEPPDRL